MAKPKTLAHKRALSRSLKGRDSHFKGKRHTIDSKQKISVGKSTYGMNFEKADKIRQDFSRGMARKDIAKKYKITYGIAKDVILNASWVRSKPIARATKPGVDF